MMEDRTSGVQEARHHAGTENRDERVLIFAPLGRDGALMVSALKDFGIESILCRDPVSICRELEAGAGMILLTIEALHEMDIQGLSAVISEQPPWSDIPIVLLTGGTMSPDMEESLTGLGNITVLERPVRMPSLLAAVRAALRGRGRQYQIRDLLSAGEIQQAHIEALNERLQRAMTETHHRVKNNLQIIGAMVDMRVMDGTQSIPIEEFQRLGMQARMLASVHDLLTQEAKEDGQADKISADAMLEKLIPMLRLTSPTRTIQFKCDAVRLPARKATSLTLLVNELVSNAIKHGKGDIGVSLFVQDGQAIFEVCDDGPGFPEGFSAGKAANVGLELVENLSRWDLGGRAEYANRPEGGARVRVVIPL
jgi:two-component sensor histidine kinase/CheY-like chemotaxis protein